MSEFKTKQLCCLNCECWRQQKMNKLGDLNLWFGLCENTLDLEGKFEIDLCDDHKWRVR
jgi:hypothetical protein